MKCAGLHLCIILQGGIKGDEIPMEADPSVINRVGFAENCLLIKTAVVRFAVERNCKKNHATVQC